MHEVRKPRVWCHTEEYAFSFDDAITTSTSSGSPFETIQLKKRDSILDPSKMLTVGKYPRYIRRRIFFENFGKLYRYGDLASFSRQLFIRYKINIKIFIRIEKSIDRSRKNKVKGSSQKSSCSCISHTLAYQRRKKFGPQQTSWCIRDMCFSERLILIRNLVRCLANYGYDICTDENFDKYLSENVYRKSMGKRADSK
ncbi:hypothetical protein V1478_012419 [Vespula squamosa]|uniref:Uncharacterized protein n=1 Tax=Vespula squamosa TaxID=30214 RepID=A0ABD2AD53_VESSQ